MSGLRVDDVCVTIEQVTALDGATITVAPGEVLGVLGPSGGGKSTLLRVIAGLQKPVSGTVSWNGDDLTRVPVHRRGFALMFQEGQLFPHRDVARNVGYAFGVKRVPLGRRAERIAELLERVGLAGYETRRVTELSGGEQQRVALARALAAEPRLLLLDEPLSALDRPLRTRLAADLREIFVTTGMPAIHVSHDVREIAVVADRVAVLAQGRIRQTGTLAELRADPVDATVAALVADD